MKKIAIFGGSFNPIHNGHINLCKACDEIYNFDEIILIPTNIPPHKSPLNLASNEARFKMCELAVVCEPKFTVSDIEQKMSGISYTINTLETLKERFPNDELYMIIGSDMLFMFHKWYESGKILEYVTLICGARFLQEKEKMQKYKEEYFDNTDKINIIDIDVFEVSSTQIRQLIEDENKVNNLLDKDVYEYILTNKLY